MASPSEFPASRPAPSGVAGWRFLLRIAGIIIVLGVVSWWLLAGRNTGWTRDKDAIKKTDEITGIEYVEYQDRFTPGIELLTLGTLGGLVLIGVTFFRKKPTHTS